MIDKIKIYSEEIEQKIVDYRRDFHKYAELGWTEYRTSSIIAKRLEDLGFEVLVGREIVKEEDRMGLPSQEELKTNWNRAKEQGGVEKYLEKMKYGFTGAVGVISNGQGPTIALRFDIDALPIQETSESNHIPVKMGFSSVNDGVMHACGHDFHAAVGLGIAEIIAKNKDKLTGKVKIIFQPAEEGVRGAKSIVTKGLLDDVDFIFGHHVRDYKVGEISSGLSGYKATKKFDVTIYGKPAHAGGSPQDGNNALIAASTAVLNLYSIARHKDGETRVNVGKMSAGTGRNIIPDEAKMVIETRGSTTEISDYMYNKAINIIKNSSEMQNCTYKIKPMGEAPSEKSDSEMIELVEKLSEKLGEYTLVDIHKSGGSEDFTYMMAKVQENGGKAVNIGLGADSLGDGAHSHNFDINEKAIKKSLILLSALIFEIQEYHKANK
jgi:aminobenzoyl-glutamate utilization protein A